MKKESTPLFQISRNFVEFGAFTALEVVTFRERGVFNDHDYVRSIGAQHWLPVGLWMTEAASEFLQPKPATKAKSPSPRKRGTPSAKASKKAA